LLYFDAKKSEKNAKNGHLFFSCEKMNVFSRLFCHILHVVATVTGGDRRFAMRSFFGIRNAFWAHFLRTSRKKLRLVGAPRSRAPAPALCAVAAWPPAVAPHPSNPLRSFSTPGSPGVSKSVRFTATAQRGN
jgi:hypothetical protein